MGWCLCHRRPMDRKSSPKHAMGLVPDNVYSLAQPISVRIAPCASYHGRLHRRPCGANGSSVLFWGRFWPCLWFWLVCAKAHNIAERQRCAAVNLGCAGVKLGGVERAGHAAASLVQHVRVDHRGFDARMAQEFLDRPDIIPVFQQMGSETVPERVAGGSPGATGGWPASARTEGSTSNGRLTP